MQRITLPKNQEIAADDDTATHILDDVLIHILESHLPSGVLFHQPTSHGRRSSVPGPCWGSATWRLFPTLWATPRFTRTSPPSMETRVVVRSVVATDKTSVMSHDLNTKEQPSWLYQRYIPWPVGGPMITRRLMKHRGWLSIRDFWMEFFKDLCAIQLIAGRSKHRRTHERIHVVVLDSIDSSSQCVAARAILGLLIQVLWCFMLLKIHHLERASSSICVLVLKDHTIRAHVTSHVLSKPTARWYHQKSICWYVCALRAYPEKYGDGIIFILRSPRKHKEVTRVIRYVGFCIGTPTFFLQCLWRVTHIFYHFLVGHSLLWHVVSNPHS